jgi:hypothetical protein
MDHQDSRSIKLKIFFRYRQGSAMPRFRLRQVLLYSKIQLLGHIEHNEVDVTYNNNNNCAFSI